MSDSCTIPLTKGQVTIVDREDFERFSHLKWQVNNYGYAQRTNFSDRVCTTVLLHRAILEAGPRQIADHINGNRLDNRRANLRLTDRLGNARNRRDKRQHFGCFGIFRDKDGWRGQITFNGKPLKTAAFDDPIIAAMERDLLAIRHRGSFAVLNFKYYPVATPPLLHQEIAA